MKKFLPIILSVILLTNCAESPPPTDPIRLLVQTTWPSHGIAFIAQEKGLFAKHGVQVEFHFCQDYTENLSVYKTKSIDGTFTVFVDVISLNAEGISSQTVYLLEYSKTADLIVGHPTLNSLADLKGKTIAFDGFNTFSHLFVIKSLEHIGIHEGEFKTANKVIDKKLLEALDNGEIEAAHVWEPIATEAIVKGYKVLATGEDVPHLMLDTLIFKASVVKNRPQAIQRIVNALVEAMDILQHSPEESIDIIAKFSTISKTDIHTILEKVHLLTLQENEEMFKEGGDLFKGGQEIIDFFYSKGVLVKIPDLKQVIDGQFVENI